MEAKGNLINNCSGIKLIALATSISIILAENLSLEDQNTVANLLAAIGQNLSVIVSQNTESQDIEPK